MLDCDGALDLEKKVNKDGRQVFRSVPEIQVPALKRELRKHPSSTNFEHPYSSGSIYPIGSAPHANLLPSYWNSQISLRNTL